MFKRILQSDYLIVVICVLYFSVAAPLVPGFATIWNLKTILGYSLPLIVAAAGLTVVLITAGIDLSITSIIAVTSVVGGMIMNGETGWLAGSPLATPLAIAGMLFVGMLMGFANGVSVAWLKIPPFMATLVMMMFGSGFAIWITQSRKIFELPPSFLSLTGNQVLEVSLVAIVVLALHLFLSRTRYGKWLYAIGQNPETARISGTPVSSMLLTAYVLSGLTAAMSSILFTATLETADPEMARTNLLDIIGATVISGVSLFGGKGRVTWTVFGVLLLVFIDNTLNLSNVSFFFITMTKGGVILAAALLDVLRRRL